MELRFVLESVGVKSKIQQYRGGWLIVVSSEHALRASDEIASYQCEAAEQSTERSVAIPTYGGAMVGVSVYAGVLMLVAVLMGRSAFGLDWWLAGQMQAGMVMDGQWWRTITALTLHLDPGHIGSNLVFGCVFGLMAGRVLGGGVAWLVILFSGALGNLVNAMLQSADHTSIGASTAVFSALGVLVAHALKPRSGPRENFLKRWSPLIGGLVIFGFTGIGGENTDVTAHATGLLAGLVLGWLGVALPPDWLGSRRVQQICGVAALAFVVVAWTIGLAIAG
jgi:membrane associated rhomboid family serine protease